MLSLRPSPQSREEAWVLVTDKPGNQRLAVSYPGCLTSNSLWRKIGLLYSYLSLIAFGRIKKIEASKSSQKKYCDLRKKKERKASQQLFLLTPILGEGGKCLLPRGQPGRPAPAHVAAPLFSLFPQPKGSAPNSHWCRRPSAQSCLDPGGIPASWASVPPSTRTRPPLSARTRRARDSSSSY